MSDANNRRNQLSDLITQKGAKLSNPAMLLPANPFFELAGEEFGRRLLLTSGVNDVEYCLRPEFTLTIAKEFLNSNQQSAAIAYMGKIFRQRASGPCEFDQLGIEFLGQKNIDVTLEKIFDFVLSAIKIYEPVSTSSAILTIGSVAIFETILAQIDIPKVWQPRIRHRFGQKQGMARLLKRLSDPHSLSTGALPWKKPELIKVISDQMIAASISLNSSRTPEEIANRYFEKQQLANSKVPSEAINFLQDYLNIKGDAINALNSIEALAKDNGLDIIKPLERVKSHIKTLAQKYEINNIIFDAGFSPRLDYYTGIVFEIKSEQKTLASGGEYDRLLQRLGASSQINASGCSIWIDHLEEMPTVQSNNVGDVKK